ncbi:alpha/beta fold hydrolase [Streptomyces sp. M10(2022)]
MVLAVDALGWGPGPLGYEDQQALAANFFQVGSSLAGLAAHEDIRAAAFLASLEEVDENRVGAVGLSMGGYRAWQVSALCDTVRAAVAVCWMTGLREMLVPGNNTLRGQSAYHMLHPASGVTSTFRTWPPGGPEARDVPRGRQGRAVHPQGWTLLTRSCARSGSRRARAADSSPPCGRSTDMSSRPACRTRHTTGLTHGSSAQ